ncbi:hypothetical protein [Bordetella bronchiseptica]|uniref:hypothetical protein n=1 Tax=Bordetella bronchiseptica TaxID=518 RepID=UPI0005293CAE|nr:hypothetical protein [Bordetella bronchiseptica]
MTRRQQRKSRMTPRLLAVAVSGLCVSGCETTPGGSSAAPDAYASVPSASGQLRSLGPVPDPAAALQARALRDINHLLTQGEALFAPGQGVSCPVSYPLEAVNRRLRANGSPEEAPPLVYALNVVSGACPSQGSSAEDFKFEGPVDYILVTHKRKQSTGDDHDDILLQERRVGVYAGGMPVGEHKEFGRALHKHYRRLFSGEIMEMRAAGRDAGKPMYSVYYQSYGGGGAPELAGTPVGGTVDFFSPDWLAQPLKTTITVAAYPDASRRVVTIYEDGEPVRRFRARKMDGQYVLHGWYEYLKPRGNSVCYQHAVQIHATECADL